MKKFKPSKKFMKLAIDEAKKAIEGGNYAIGAVVVKEGKVIGKGAQSSHSNNDASAHAEIVAMRQASKKLGTMYLTDCVLYTTNEPCCMCAGMAIWGRVECIVYGASIKDMLKYWKEIGNEQKLMPCKKIIKGYGAAIEIVPNFMRKECIILFNLNSKINKSLK
ncbi:nucleoside deaminase [Candidatus Pacearchaeota archaeon]|nr:nucleoside deaminase [Candidatus Pacearchaeota archaeon]